MRKIAGTFLGVCMMFAAATLPVSAQGSEYFVEESGVTYVVNAEAEDAGEIDPLYLETDEQGRLVFTNFAELKELAAGSYDTYTSAIYGGEGTLVIEEDLELPENLNISYLKLSIPFGVTLTTNSSIISGGVNIEGTLILNGGYLQVGNELTITGELINNSQLNIEAPLNVTGLEKMQCSEESRVLWLYFNCVNMNDFNEVVVAASAETDPRVYFFVHLGQYVEFVIDESTTIPVNLTAQVFDVSVAEGCTVDLKGQMNLHSARNMEVMGTLNNEGILSISSGNNLQVSGLLNNIGIVNIRDDSTMTVTDSGKYTGYGVINIYGVEEADIALAVPGLDLAKYKAVEQDTGYETYWEVHVDTGFDDVEAGAYYEAPVLWAVENGITNGHGSTTTFCPELNCTRGQVVTFLWRAKGCPEPASLENPFTDVAEDAYYYKAVLWAVEQGITNGYGSDTIFNPDGECTRGQVATFMWRAEGEPAVGNTQNIFTDVKSGEYYYDAVLWAVENGVTNGYGSADTFCPEIICNRGQIVTFLYRGMN